MRRLVLLCLAVLVAAGCGSGPATTTSATTTTAAGPGTTTTGVARPTSTGPRQPGDATSPPTSTAYGTTPVSVAGPGETALLAAVRAAAQNGFDRVAFEFANRLPGYAVGYVERPIVQDGSGHDVAVKGDAVLRVAMTPATGTDLSGGGKPVYTGPQRLDPGTPALAEVVEVGDFEGHLTWVIGVPAHAGFHVSVLDAPPRLVVDVERG